MVISALLTIYIIGIVISLAVMYEPFPARIGIALLWPLGPLAFVVVVGLLLFVAVPIMFPRAGAVLILLALGALWLAR